MGGIGDNRSEVAGSTGVGREEEDGLTDSATNAPMTPNAPEASSTPATPNTSTAWDTPTIAFVTLGCAKNEVDTASMTLDVKAAGYQVVEDPSTADVVVVNTCSFIQAATEESIDAIFEISGLDNFERGDAKLIVAGCMPARYGDDLASELSEAAAFVPCSKEDDIVSIIATTLGRPASTPEASQSFEDPSTSEAFAPAPSNVGDQIADQTSPRDANGDQAPLASSHSAVASLAPGGMSALEGRRSQAHEVFAGNPAAYVKIADGCNRFCSFCTIPYIRGRYHSFTYGRIRRDVEMLVHAGVREVTLIAQDTGRWGSDLGEGHDTAWLLDRLAEEFGQTWFRLMYIEPDGITDGLLDVIARRPNVCSYLDMPLQHSNPRVLKAMNRHGSHDEFVALVDRIREKVPNIVLRTTLIAGFPGETDKEAAELLDFLEEVQLDYVGVFTYSREEGTRAAKMPDQIDEDVKVERAQEIRDLCDGIGADRVAQRVGQDLDVLVLGREEDGRLYGRAMCQAPDVDGVVYIDRGNPGDIVRVTITDTLMYEMEGDVIDG